MAENQTADDTTGFVKGDYSSLIIEDDGAGGIARFTRADNFAMGETGAAVEQLNLYLQAAGYLTAEDLAKQPGLDSFGTGTANAVQLWQKANGITGTRGSIGPDDLRAMRQDIIDSGAAPNSGVYADAGGIDLKTNFGASIPLTSTPGSSKPPDFQNPGDIPGTDMVGPPQSQSVIPTGMRLVIVNNAAGSDTGQVFFAVGTINGVDVAYEIGDKARLRDLFGGIGSFDNVESMNQTTFDNKLILTVGTVDEILGSTESLQAQAERDMREFGLQNPPDWIVNDPKAMFILMTGTNEGWAAEKTWNEMSSLGSFKERFPWLNTMQGQLGVNTIFDAVQEGIKREDQIRASLLGARGPNAVVDSSYLKGLVASGWQPAEVAELLSLEKRVKDNPAALQNINEILQFQGLDALSQNDFVSFLQDQDAVSLNSDHTPSDIFEGVNDALRFQALLTEGLDIDLGFATELGTGSSDKIASEGQFSQQAQLAASFIAKNQGELDFAKMGLERDDIIAAVFGEKREGGKSVSEVNSILETFAKERSRAAQGFSGSQSFINARGRLVQQGFSDFG